MWVISVFLSVFVSVIISVFLSVFVSVFVSVLLSAFVSVLCMCLYLYPNSLEWLWKGSEYIEGWYEARGQTR